MKLQELLAKAEERRERATAREANDLSLRLALEGIDAGRRAARMELERTDLLHGIRDRIMEERQMAATPAEKEARKDPQYIQYCDDTNHLKEQGERATEWARYYDRLAVITAVDWAVEEVAHG